MLDGPARTSLSPTMPIRSDLRPLYPSNWPEISNRVRFDRAGGRCEACSRRHAAWIYQLPDGRWRELGTDNWRDGRGAPAPAPIVRKGDQLRMVRVVLTCAHLNHWPPDVSEANLAAWCCRCHLAYDRAHHAASRRRRMAIGDLFLGLYGFPPQVPPN